MVKYLHVFDNNIRKKAVVQIDLLQVPLVEDNYIDPAIISTAFGGIIGCYRDRICKTCNLEPLQPAPFRTPSGLRD